MNKFRATKNEVKVLEKLADAEADRQTSLAYLRRQLEKAIQIKPISKKAKNLLKSGKVVVEFMASDKDVSHSKRIIADIRYTLDEDILEEANELAIDCVEGTYIPRLNFLV